jgi:hypothetical protein
MESLVVLPNGTKFVCMIITEIVTIVSICALYQLAEWASPIEKPDPREKRLLIILLAISIFWTLWSWYGSIITRIW